MKPLAQSKQRLAPVLTERSRVCLALWMLDRVLQAVIGCAGIDETVVIGGDEAVASLVHARGARWEPEAVPGLNPTLQRALAEAQEDGFDAMLFLPADLPLACAADIRGAVGGPAGRVVLAPGCRRGTNAILVPAGIDFRFRLGEESFRRHIEDAARKGILWRTYHNTHIEADIDIPEDLAELEDAVPGLWGRVARMKGFLAACPEGHGVREARVGSERAAGRQPAP